MTESGDGGVWAGAVWRPSPGKRGAFLHARLVERGRGGIRVRRLGGDRAGEMRVTRFLRNKAVSLAEMVASAASRTRAAVAGRAVLAIQDTTSVRDRGKQGSILLHPTIAVDADSLALIGLVDCTLLTRRGGLRGRRRERSFTEKESRRWLVGANSAAALAAAGATAVTVIADREGDLYEDFALKPPQVELVIRAGQDRLLADGKRLFACAASLSEAGRMVISLVAAPGRPAREATLVLRFGEVILKRPASRNAAAAAGLPETVRLTVIEAVEIDPPAGSLPAHWRLLTTHAVRDLDAAQRIVGFYRQRWLIEELFRTMKRRGFDIEAVGIADQPFAKLAAATLIAAIDVLKLVRDRDGLAGRPLEDVLDPADRPILETVSARLEGKTARQKNPHPKGSLAFAAWTFARLGGWTGYYGKPGPLVILHGLNRFHDIKHGHAIHDV